MTITMVIGFNSNQFYKFVRLCELDIFGPNRVGQPSPWYVDVTPGFRNKTRINFQTYSDIISEEQFIKYANIYWFLFS